METRSGFVGTRALFPKLSQFPIGKRLPVDAARGAGGRRGLLDIDHPAAGEDPPRCKTDAPKIGEPILDRCSSQQDTKIGVHCLGRIGDAYAWRRDFLGLVEQHRGESDTPKSRL